jgi:hypothetical protein
MKKILYIPIYFLQLFCLVAVLSLLSGCKKEEENPPVITEIRNYDASPNDTLVQTLEAGQWVVVLGKNLSGVTQVYFGGTPATINNTMLMDGSLVVQVPWIPFQSVPRDKVNIITAVTSSGMATFEINITGAPLITHVRNYAPAPNDTIVDAVVPGQQVNIIGFNINNATKIAFQGVEANLEEAVYTDSSVIVKLPLDFSKANPALANKISYSTKVDSSTYSIIIYDPELLKLYSDPLFKFLTGGIGKQKTWVIDLDANAKSKVFVGPLYFASDDLRWGNELINNGWQWQADYQSWMPPVKDYGTMTFELQGSVVVQPVVKVTQKNVEAAKNGTFTGSFFMDLNAKTLNFTDVNPLQMTWENVDWAKAYIISLTEEGLQLGFKHKGKPELEVYNYIKK